jgi:hypothetical protein
MKETKMAKKKQMRIADTFDEVPEAVTAAADVYVTAKRNVAKFREKMNVGREDLICKMKENGITELRIDDEEKLLRLVDDCKIKIEARKEENKDATDADNDSEM